MSTERSTEARRQALAWIARQLRWERTLADLRAGRVARQPERKAA